MKNNEDTLQIAISDWIRFQYPHVIFTSSLDGFKLTMGQAIKAKKMRSGKGFPDLMIFKPSGIYHGLFIELKIESPFKKGGTLKKSEHLENQAAMHKRLWNEGYCVYFAWSFEQTIEIINKYLKI